MLDTYVQFDQQVCKIPQSNTASIDIALMLC